MIEKAFTSGTKQIKNVVQVIGVNISIVKDMLGHADESTTLRHYIYNIEDNTETYDKVLDVLEDRNAVKSDQSDQKVIAFPANKKAENLDISKPSAL